MMQGSKSHLVQSKEFRVLLCLQLLLLAFTGTAAYFTATHCLNSCDDPLYPHHCMSQGDSYCCQNSTTNCESCLFQNTHCLEFMVGAVIGCLLSFLLMVYLIWVCRSHRRNIQRSLLSSTVSLLIEPASQ